MRAGRDTIKVIGQGGVIATLCVSAASDAVHVYQCYLIRGDL